MQCVARWCRLALFLLFCFCRFRVAAINLCVAVIHLCVFGSSMRTISGDATSVHRMHSHKQSQQQKEMSNTHTHIHTHHAIALVPLLNASRIVRNVGSSLTNFRLCPLARCFCVALFECFHMRFSSVGSLVRSLFLFRYFGFGKRKNYGVAVVYVLIVASIPIFFFCVSSVFLLHFASLLLFRFTFLFYLFICVCGTCKRVFCGRFEHTLTAYARSKPITIIIHGQETSSFLFVGGSSRNYHAGTIRVPFLFIAFTCCCCCSHILAGVDDGCVS